MSIFKEATFKIIIPSTDVLELVYEVKVVQFSF